MKFGIAGGVCLVVNGKLAGNIPGGIEFKVEDFCNPLVSDWECEKFEQVELVYIFDDEVPTGIVPIFRRITNPFCQGNIQRKVKTLPISMEINHTYMSAVVKTKDVSLSYKVYLISALDALLAVGKKYKFDTSKLEAERQKCGEMPLVG